MDDELIYFRINKLPCSNRAGSQKQTVNNYNIIVPLSTQSGIIPLLFVVQLRAPAGKIACSQF